MQAETQFGDLLASREFQWAQADGVLHFAYVDIGVPYLDPPRDVNSDSAWGCKIRTRGLGLDRTVVIFGVDAIQAIYLALAYAGNEVANSIVASRLDWKDVPNFGFPELPPVPAENAAPPGDPNLQPLP